MKVWPLARRALLGLAPLLGCSENEAQEPGGPAVVAGAGGGEEPSFAGAGAGGSVQLDAPVEEAALLEFIEEERYTGWPREAAIHASAGPHGKDVRVYYSPKAAAALARGDATLPAGAASIKELSSGGKVYGYAVWVKVQPDTDEGRGFYWYEVTDRQGMRTVYANALGSDVCVGCHSAGKDYSLSTLPFE